MEQICEIKTEYYKMRIYEENIVEIEFLESHLGLSHLDNFGATNISTIRDSIEYHINKNFVSKREKFILVFNLKNVKYINSAVVGATIEAKNKITKYNKKDTMIYAININNNVLRTYKLLGLDHEILLLGFDSVDDIYYIEKIKLENKDIIIDIAADKMQRMISNYNEIEEIKKQKISDDADRRYLQNNIDNTINELIAIEN